MVRAGRLKVGDYLAASQNFQGDRNRAVIGEVIGVIPRIHDAIASPADRPAFEAWVRKFLGPIASDLEKDTPARPEWSEIPPQGTRIPPMPGMPLQISAEERAALRTDVLNMLTAYGDDPELNAKAFDTVDAYMKDPSYRGYSTGAGSFEDRRAQG